MIYSRICRLLFTETGIAHIQLSLFPLEEKEKTNHISIETFYLAKKKKTTNKQKDRKNRKTTNEKNRERKKNLQSAMI